MRGKIGNRLVWMLSIAAVIMSLAACGKSLERQIAEQLELGQKYLTEMDYEQAILAFQKAIELEPKTKPAYTGLAQAHKAKGEILLAAEALETGYGYFSEEDMKAALLDAYEEAVLAYDQDAERLMGFYIRMIELDPSQEAYYLKLAQIYKDRGETEKAMEILEDGYEATQGEQIRQKIDEESLGYTKEDEAFLETVYEIGMAGDLDEICRILESDAYKELSQNAETPVYYPGKDGKAIGVFPGYLYIGDVKNGMRHGQGQWISYGVNQYRFTGQWVDDYPNGPGEEYKISSVTTTITGNYRDGYEDGEMTFVLQERDKTFTWHYQVNHGSPVAVAENEGDYGDIVVALSAEEDENHSLALEEIVGVYGAMKER